MTYLSGLLETTKLVRSGAALDELLGTLARTIADSLGFGAVVVNIYRPGWDDLIVAAVHGPDEARELLLGTTQTIETWQPLLDDRFLRRGAYFIKAGELDWSQHDLTVFVPEVESTEDEAAWNAHDALMIPMQGDDGDLLGILSVDEPISGARPTDQELDLLVAFAGHAAFAIEQAQRVRTAEEHSRALQSLMRTSAEATRATSPSVVLRSIAAGVREALGFQRVMIAMLNDVGDYEVDASVGWEPGHPAIETAYPARQMDRLFDPSFEIEGCYLMPREEALRRVDVTLNTYSSEMNGRGPRAWNHHWLTVPLWGRDGSITGVLIADEPADRCLPSPPHLRALRLFANHAAAAVEASRSFSAVQEAKTLLQVLISASPVAIIAVDRDMRVTLWNAAAELLFGWPEEDVLRHDLPVRVPIKEELTNAIQQRTSVQTERELPTRDGGSIECAMSVAPLLAEDQVQGAVCLFTDITARNELAEKLLQRQKLETIGLLAGGIAHDFNNLLAVMLGNASLAIDEVDPRTPLHDYLAEIQLASETAGQLTQQMLAYAGKAKLMMAPVDVSALLRESSPLLKRAVPATVRFSMTFEDGIPTVHGDAAQLQQVAMSLIVNGAESVEGNGLMRLSVYETHLSRDDLERLPYSEGVRAGGFVCVEVSDTGAGIDADDLSRIFDPFFSTKFVGRGLGLAAVLGIVTSHGGAIRIDSTPGIGTTVAVYLPAETSPQPTAVAPEAVEFSAITGTVLLVEDEKVVRDMGTRILSASGFQVLTASSGGEALAVLLQNPEIDVVVLDITMPGLSAIETKRRMQEAAPDISFVVCSGHSEQQVRQDFGFGDDPLTFVAKPYRRENLVNQVAGAAAGRI